MDLPAFKEKIGHAWPPLDPDLVRKVYGDYREARWLFENARSAGIRSLNEGSHQLTLENIATLSVYARLHTPSLGDWGFQYIQIRGITLKL